MALFFHSNSQVHRGIVYVVLPTPTPLRKTKQIPDQANDRPGEVLVSVCPAVLHDAEHAVGNLLQRIHHTARVALAGAEAEERERVRLTLSDLERLLELLFDYVSPVQIAARPTDAAKVASSVVSHVRSHTSGSVEMVGEATGRLMVDPRALTRCFQLIGDSLGDFWKESASVVVDVGSGQNGDGLEFAIRASDSVANTVDACGRVALAVAGRLIEMQGGELHWSSDPVGACRVVLPIDGEGRSDGI